MSDLTRSDVSHSELTHSEPTHSELTESNRRIVEAFADLFYTKGDAKTAFESFVAVDYQQHNPGVANGRDAAIAFLVPMFSDPDASFDVKRILVDGDLAAVHQRAHPAGRAPLAVADFYRLEHGLIVEHWDVLQPIPEAADSVSAMF